MYRALFRRIIEKHNYYVVRTQDDDYVNMHLGIKKELTPFISFGTDTIMFCPSAEVREKFRKEHGINEKEFVVVYTGKLTEAKGGKLLAETFRDQFEVPVTLVCVGTPPDSEYGREVQKILDASENRVIMFPTQKYMELAQFYQMADLSIFPKQCSMSFYDAQACGLPVVSEANNVNCDRCSHQNGDNFEAGNVEDFRAKIMKFAMLNKEELEQYRKNGNALVSDSMNRLLSFLNFTSGDMTNPTGGRMGIFGRSSVYAESFEVIKNSPVIGSGIFNMKATNGMPYPHNFILETWIHAGFLYMVLWVGIFISLWRKGAIIAAKDIRHSWVLFILSYVTVFLSVSGTYLWCSELWFLIGVLFSFFSDTAVEVNREQYV